MNPEETQTEMVRAAGFEPAARTISTPAILDSAPLALTGDAPPYTPAEKIRPLSSPLPSTARRLSRAELRYLVGVLEREIGHWGLSSAQGDYADAMRKKLLTIHAQGWEETN